MNDTTQYVVRRSTDLGPGLQYPNFRWARRTARQIAKDEGRLMLVYVLDRAPACRGFYVERLFVAYMMNGLGEMVTLHPPKDSFKYAQRTGILARPESRNPATLAQHGDFR